jgi:hypothetical protein
MASTGTTSVVVQAFALPLRALFLDCLDLEDWADDCPQTSVTNYQPTGVTTQKIAELNCNLIYLFRCMKTKRSVGPVSDDGYFEKSTAEFHYYSPRSCYSSLLMTSPAPLLT